MDRQDYKKEEGFGIGQHDEATGTRDLSTTVLSGTRAEADLIVKALAGYMGVEAILRAHGVQLEREPIHIYRDEQTAEAKDLLAQIREPNYQEPEAESTETEKPFIREPLYLMEIDGNQHWLTKRQAGIAYDSGMVPVSIGGYVLEGPGEARLITDAERRQISDIADDWSASK